MSRSERLLRLAGTAGPVFLKTWMTTLRMRRIGDREQLEARRRYGGAVYAFWHGQIMFASYAGRNRGARVLISTHRDGEYVARVVKGMGYDPARGSSTRGGVKGLIQLAKTSKGKDLAITPDGPLGPRHTAQMGAILLAQFTGFPLMPAAGAAIPHIHMPSWDRFVVPLPFARAAFIWGDPIVVPRRPDAEEREALRRRLEDTLNDLTRRAHDLCR